MTTCFGHLTIIRPSLQENKVKFNANNVHVIWGAMRLTSVYK